MYICIYFIYIYICIYICVCKCIYIYVHIFLFKKKTKDRLIQDYKFISHPIFSVSGVNQKHEEKIYTGHLQIQWIIN